MNTPVTRESVVLCDRPDDLYEPRARAMLGRVMRDTLDENKILPMEMVHSLEQAKMIMESERDFASLIQRVAVMQAQVSKQSIVDRTKKLHAATTGAYTQLEALTKKLPPAPLQANQLTQLAASDPLYGDRLALAALSRHMAYSKTWIEKAERVLALEPKADDAAFAVLDQALAEILLSKTAIPELLGKAKSAQHRVTQFLALLDRRYAGGPEDIATEIAERLVDVAQRRKMPAMREAILVLLRRLLAGAAPLGPASDPPDASAEFKATRETYDTLTRDQGLAVELGVADLIEARMKRLVTREALTQLVPGYNSAPKLIQAIALYKQTVGDGPREILGKYIAYLLEHRDLAKDFTDPSTTGVERVEIIQAVREAIITAGFTDHRREHFVELIDALMKASQGSEQRRSPRTQCGPEDHVMLESRRVALKNWSAIGLLFGPTTGDFPAGQKLRLTVRIKNPKITIGFDAEAEVVRYTDEGLVAVKYKALDRQVAKTISTYFDPVGAAKG